MVAGGGPATSRDAGLAAACAVLDYLGTYASAVDPAKVNALAGFPVNLVQLSGSELTVTYGELNTLADYISSPAIIDSLPQSVLLPILQMTRSSGWRQLNAMRTQPQPDIDMTFRSYLPDIVVDTVSSAWETYELDNLTTGVGVSGRDHYNGLNARNACHFAPFTWWRWQASYAAAVTKAAAAYASGGDVELVRQAWVAHGYADHFLQDSFAAGHLVNKSLIMQWFVEWVSGQHMPVYDWNAIKTMTQANQPGLSGQLLYSPSYSGLSNDPQTSEELGPAQSARVDNTGLVAAAGQTQLEAYQSYLSWLESPVCQIVTKQVHDYFNKSGLTVSSSQQAGYEVFGDATMLNGGQGVTLASAAATLSRRSITDILTRGGSDITQQQLVALLPDQVLVEDAYMSLQDWHARGGPLWDLCRSSSIFDSWTSWAFGGGSHTVLDQGVISVDRPESGSFSPVWAPATGEGVSCAAQPASCVALGEVYVVSQTAGGSLLVTTAPGSGIGASTTTLDATSPGPPAAGVVGGAPTIAWVEGDGTISMAVSDDGNHWSLTGNVGSVTGANPSGGVAIVESDSQTFVAWTTGAGSSSQISWAAVPSDGSPATSSLLPKSTGGSRPVAATDGNLLYVAFQIGGQGIGAAEYSGGQWTSISPTGVKTSGGVGLQVLAGTPVLAYRGSDGKLWWDVRKGSTGASWSNQSLPNPTPTTAPAVGVDANGDGFLAYGQNGVLTIVPAHSGSWSAMGYCVGGYYSDSPVTVVPYGQGLLQFMTFSAPPIVCQAELTSAGWGTVSPVPGLSARGRVGADFLPTAGDAEILWLAVVDATSRAVTAATFDGTTWTTMPPVTGPQGGQSDAALINWAGEIHVFYPSGSSLCHSQWDATEAAWVNLGAVPGVLSPLGVSVAIVDGTLYLAWVSAASGSSGLAMTVGWDGQTWQQPRQADTASVTASIAANGNALVILTNHTDGNVYCSYSLNGGQKWNGHTRLGPGFNPGLAAGFTPGSDPEQEGLQATFLSKAGGYNGLMTQLMTVAEP